MNALNTTTGPPIGAVLFDYGMVLSGPPNADAWARMRTFSSLDEETLQREYWAHRHPYDRGTHTGEAYWHLIAAGGGTAFNAEQIAGLIQADTDLWTDLNQPMVNWAQRLQSRGIKTGILSNLGDAMAEGLLRKFDWIAAFDHCTWSHALKLAKPEQAIYRHAAEGLGAAPESILFIDDRADNIEAAREFGMQTVRYTGHAEFVDEMRLRGWGSLL